MTETWAEPHFIIFPDYLRSYCICGAPHFSSKEQKRILVKNHLLSSVLQQISAKLQAELQGRRDFTPSSFAFCKLVVNFCCYFSCGVFFFF